ncbi:MCM2/3/5 family protein [Nitzschia inconspicua]|uniref:DNA helicase n=1 Tax=Nitzschia inconspicua TaxID=303405 RepID=A0A9K3LH82_9STRA|nr:MCM2/3/5 family protein [Nitzschia inconspicua]
MDFDLSDLYFSRQQLQRETSSHDAADGTNDIDPQEDGSALSKKDLDAARRHFREFLRNYRLGTQRYIYREKLLRMHRRLSTNSSRASSGAGALLENEPNVFNDAGTASNANTNNNRSASQSLGGNAMLEIDVAHLGEYDVALLGHIREHPAALLPELEIAASDALDTLLYDLRTEGQQPEQLGNDENRIVDGGNEMNRGGADNIQRKTFHNNPSWLIQILLKGNLAMTPLRSIQSSHINKLIKCPGIVISATPIQVRAVQLTVRCHRCYDTQTVLSTEGPYGSVPLPSKCQGVDAKECGPNPYAVVADESQFTDRQKIKLQEAPEKVPTGEMPRSVMVAVERGLVDKAPPGTRVSIFCIPTLFGSNGNASSSTQQKVYLRCVGLSKDNSTGESAQFTPAEEEAFGQLARRRDVFEILTRSVAPSIQGSYTVDIKKALVCMLMGGTRKRLPDGLRLRGDINVLLLGDPSTAKSQFLKFISKASPIGIYTSGKGSSAAGLTASVVKNQASEWYLEAGALVLGDGGIVCIDEFDKMRPQDRVAIHEAMEQQTISVAKAGITTVLNSRAAVLAAANPVFGRYDDFKSASENIDLMTTILSRFDLIFLVRDIREEERDLMICRHVMGVHINNSGANGFSATGGVLGDTGSDLLSASELLEGEAGDHDRMESLSNAPEAIAENVMKVATTGRGELDIPAMKKYVQYCKSKCKPTLSEEAGQVLTSAYVKIRDDVRKSTIQTQGPDAQSVIPITVRQLEALVRISESLAKVRLDSEVRIEDVNEAMRLFRVSTMAANATDQNNSMGEQSILGNENNREEIERTQRFLHTRLSIGSTVNKQKLIEEASGQGYSFVTMSLVLSVMAQRGEILERNQGRLLKRIK